MKYETFSKGISALTQAYPGRKIEPEIYWTMLQDLDDAAFLKAILWIVQGREDIYPGTNLIAVIRKKALDVISITAGEAWSEVRSEISRVGHNGTPRFSSPLVHKSVNCIGWRTICISENIGVERAHFTKIYEQLAEREDESNLINPDYKRVVANMVKRIGAENVHTDKV